MPTPPPAPPPSPPPASAFVTTEYSRNGAAWDRINVIPAYQAGTFGARSLVAIIDSGVDAGSSEFAGRIDSRSADLGIPPYTPANKAHTGGESLQDTAGHGTAVAGIVGSAKDDSGIQGVAPQTRLLIFRGDTNDATLTISGGAISEGVRRAALARAQVLNFSFGSNDPSSRSDFDSLLNQTSAADIVTVLAAGNDSNPDPDGSALAAIDPQARGAAIIAGAIDSAGVIASFSNQAGAGAAFYLAAPGRLLQVPAIGGGLRNFSGTSASTPVIAGAAALIRDHWPQLTAAQTVDILLRSAADAGAPGTDPVYGRGILDIGAALQPLGARATQSAAGQSIEIADEGLSFSPAFGGFSPALGDFVFLDSYGRDFRAPLSGLVAPSTDLSVAPENALHADETRLQRVAATARGALRLRLVSEPAAAVDAAAAFRDADLERERRERFAFALTQTVGPDLVVTAAQGFSSREIGAVASDLPSTSTLARDGFTDSFLPADENASSVVFNRGAPFGLRADLLVSYVAPPPRRYENALFGQTEGAGGRTQTNMRLGLRRQVSAARLRIEAGYVVERNGLLGATVANIFSQRFSSRTAYAAFAAEAPLPAGVHAVARAAIGGTSASGDGILAAAEHVASTQFAAGLWRASMFASGDRLSFAVVQPLRVERGTLRFDVPDAYDQSARRLLYATRTVALGAPPREVDLEASYALGPFEAAVLHQFDVDESGRDATLALLRGAWSF